MTEEDSDSDAEIDLSNIITDELIKEVQAAIDARVLRLIHPYVFDLIKLLTKYPNGLKRTFVLDYIKKNREKLGLPIPDTFDSTVQSSMQYYCRDSDVFKTRSANEKEALFCWPKGKGKGIWALLRQLYT
jgi:hypothetical protein